MPGSNWEIPFLNYLLCLNIAALESPLLEMLVFTEVGVVCRKLVIPPPAD